VVSQNDLDGYVAASVEYFDDDDDPATSPGIFLVRAELENALSGLGSRDTMVEQHGPAPEGSNLPSFFSTKFANITPLCLTDAKAFSFWVAGMLPLPLPTKQHLLAMTSTETRLEELTDLVDSLKENANNSKCVIQ
jgi:hypothetical protein